MPVFHNDSLDDPLVYERLPSFSGGQVSFERANVLEPNQAALLENVTILINGELRKRRGTRPLGAGYVVEEGAAIQGMIQYETSARNSLLAFCDQWALALEDGLWVRVFKSALSSSGERPDIVQLTDDLYWTDSGRAGIRRWNGSSVSTIPDSPAATILERHGTRLVASGVAEIPDAIYFSDFLDGETWDMTNGQIRIGGGDGDPIIAIKSWQDTGLLVFKRNSTWLVDANPQVSVAEFSVKLIHRTIGCSAKRSVAQVGQDVWFLSRTGVQSVRKQLATSNNEITVPVSQAIQDVVQRIRWDHARKGCGVFYNNYYLLSVPVNSDSPDTVLVFHYLTGGWTTFTGWDAEILYEQPIEGTSRLLLGRPDGEIRAWLDYFAGDDEPNDAYKDGVQALGLPFNLDEEGVLFPLGADVVSTIRTRAMTFGDFVSPKSGFYGEFEFVTTDVTVQITAVRDGKARTVVKWLNYDLAQAELPVSLPFYLAGEGWTNERFPIHHFPPFRELQYEIASPTGKLVLRDVNSSAFLDTVETTATSGVLPAEPPAAEFDFEEPSLSLLLALDGSDLLMHATVGPGMFGAYQLVWFVNDVQVAMQTITGPGIYTKSTPAGDAGGDFDVTVRLVSMPPLPTWQTEASDSLSVSAISYFEFDLTPYFPGGGWTDPPGFPYGDGHDFGPYPEKRWVYSHAANPASVDDDLYVNGVPFMPDNLAGPINGGVTTLILVVESGLTFNLNVWNNGASYGASGRLRLYDRPLA